MCRCGISWPSRSCCGQKSTGILRRHIPDYLLFNDAEPVVVDVKPRHRVVRRENAFTFAWTRRAVRPGRGEGAEPYYRVSGAGGVGTAAPDIPLERQAESRHRRSPGRRYVVAQRAFELEWTQKLIEDLESGRIRFQKNQRNLNLVPEGDTDEYKTS